MIYAGEGDMKKPRATIQIKKAREAAGMEIGEEVTVTITGIVRSIDSPRESTYYGPEGGKSRMMPGCIEMEIKSIAINGEEADEE